MEDPEDASQDPEPIMINSAEAADPTLVAVLESEVGLAPQYWDSAVWQRCAVRKAGTAVVIHPLSCVMEAPQEGCLSENAGLAWAWLGEAEMRARGYAGCTSWLPRRAWRWTGCRASRRGRPVTALATRAPRQQSAYQGACSHKLPHPQDSSHQCL